MITSDAGGRGGPGCWSPDGGSQGTGGTSTPQNDGWRSGWKLQAVIRKAIVKVFADEMFVNTIRRGQLNQASAMFGSLFVSAAHAANESGDGELLTGLELLGENIPAFSTMLAYCNLYEDGCFPGRRDEP